MAVVTFAAKHFLKYNFANFNFPTLICKRHTSKFSKIPKQQITLIDEELDEKFVRGSGPGGQSINKTRNRVQLTHLPTGISVSCQDFRDLTSNRKHAKTILLRKLDLSINGESSVLGKRIIKERKRKSKQSQRAKLKYGTDKEKCELEEIPLLSKKKDKDD